jgi:hypothetical protein
LDHPSNFNKGYLRKKDDDGVGVSSIIGGREKRLRLECDELDAQQELPRFKSLGGRLGSVVGINSGASGDL